jgi:ATP-dependent 26S proteasome regulatory subunit
MEKKNSFESEGCSDCEEDDIKTKADDKKEREEDNATLIENLSLIKAISQTLTSIVENNKKMANYKEIVKKQSKMYFSANLVPDISIEKYLERIQTYSNMEKSTLILSLIYIDKLCHNCDVILTYYNIHRILFTAILMSIKYNEDSYYDNKYYSEIAGVKLKELKLLEYTFISMIDFKLYIKNDTYEKYKNYLDDFEQQN